MKEKKRDKMKNIDKSENVGKKSGTEISTTTCNVSNKKSLYM